MDVCIHLGPAIFEKTTQMLEYILHGCWILRSNGLRRGNQRLALQPGVLMQNKYREDVAEQHSAGDERNPAEDEQTTGAQGSECRGYSRWNCSRCHSSRLPSGARLRGVKDLGPHVAFLIRGCLSCRVAECRHYVLGEHVLGLDTLPMLQSTKVRNDCQLTDATLGL